METFGIFQHACCVWGSLLERLCSRQPFPKQIFFFSFNVSSLPACFLVLVLCCRTTYAKVAGKYQDVLTLEQSVAELHQMFLDFALLTEQQGELLDQIEHNVVQATDYVEEANVETHTAIEYQKKVRKKQCWIILIATVAAAVVFWLVFR